MIATISPSIREILDLARWAPSGDNTQPWRFEILDEEHVLVHGFDTRDHCVYDLDGHPSQLAVGALLETMSLAATTHGRRARIIRRPDTPETHLLFDVHFDRDPEIKPDPLAAFIEKRTVQRRAMATRPITAEQKAFLAQALGDAYKVLWFEAPAQRWRMARLCFDNAKIRLTIPEAYEVHRAVIEWDVRYSADKIPAEAVGADALNLKLMRWAMASWERVDFFNTWLLGHLMPRLQLDLMPGIFCAAHFALLARQTVQTVDDYLSAGRAMQRFWLTAASLGLYVQPEMTPLIFTRYHRQNIRFTRIAAARTIVSGLDVRLRNMLGDEEIEALFFMGRIGTGPAPRARSTRKPLESLMLAS
jgi:nitroreductase